MGVNESRNIDLPKDIDSEYEKYKENWCPDVQNKCSVNFLKKAHTSILPSALENAGFLLGLYLKKNCELIKEINILEPFAGNGCASKIIYDKLITLVPKFTLKSTDLLDHSEYISVTSHNVEYGLNAVDTVEKYGDNFNILMMISPPPCSMKNKYESYCDYFAIKKWTDLPDAKFIIFIGELGASDGSEGLYNFMLNHKTWKLEERHMIYCEHHPVLGEIEKELFIFAKKQAAGDVTLG